MTCRSPAWGAHGRLSVHKPDVPRAGVTVFHRGPKMSMHRRCFARHEGEGEKGTRTGDQPLCPVPGGPGSGSACSVKPFSSAGTSSSSAAPRTSGSLTRGWAVWVGERRGEGFFLLYMPTVAQFYFSVRYKYSLERQMSPCLPTTLS